MRLHKQWTRTARWMALACVAFSAFVFLSAEPALAGERQFLVILATSPKEYNLPCVPDPDDLGVPWCPDRPYDYECTVGGPSGITYGVCVTFCDDDNDCENVSEAEGMTFVCSRLVGYCVPDYPSVESIRRQYFDKTDNDIGSFAEYWKEISYGDVTISGRVTDWISVPWRINSPSVDPPDFPELPPGYGGDGRQEEFYNFRAMVTVDINGDPGGNDDGPFSPQGNPPYALGGHDFNRTTGFPVWMPGERFIDMDGDGRWDGLDEATNLMDWNGDGMPDLDGPWTDLNQDGAADNPDNCLYLSDDDNDGNPDCCPAGPGNEGCEQYPAAGYCLPTRWEGPYGEIVDCNGNLVPDSCDISCTSQACLMTGWLNEHPGVCGTSRDELPYVELSDTECGPDPVGNGIPDECEIAGMPGPGPQYDNFECVDESLVDGDGECHGRTPCTLYATTLTDLAFNRCEFHDVNDNGELDIVEPFENYLRMWSPSQQDWVRVSDTYIRDNYPGDPNLVIAQQDARQIYGRHDPLYKLPGLCKCADGSPCLNLGGNLFSVCVAGEHVQYDPPDWWRDRGSTKLQSVGIAGVSPEPPWYAQMWRDWYGTDPPQWDPNIPMLEFFVPAEPDENQSNRIIRRFFNASHGGTHGDGTGWIGCSDAIDRLVEFEVWGDEITTFEDACNHRILPEEINGLGNLLILYDGPVEFNDLPSSKYHQTGDGRLGEITSPFLNHIWGQDLGDNNPNTSSGPDGIIPAAGPYATHVHGNLGYDAGNVLSLELLTVKDHNLDGLVDQGTITYPGTENYSAPGRQRLVEDCIEILDDMIDFDDFVDTVTLDYLGGGDAHSVPVPPAYITGDPNQDSISPSGVCSGIVLLPENVHLRCAYHTIGSDLFPVHNEDGLNDPSYAGTGFPQTGAQLSWNILFHDLVRGIDVPSCSLTIPSGNYQTAYAAHQWLHTWEGFPDLYDYDVFQSGTIENCPVAYWDIMADGGLVHPAPILKEKPGTEWIKPVNLTMVLTPGVESVLTLPRAEFYRDDSYYYLENENRPGERYYFWSAGSGFDERMPGDGMLLLHTDITPTCETNADCPAGFPCVGGYCKGAVSNPDALPAQQRSGTRPTYLIVQADGLAELEACDDRGDPGDPWPGPLSCSDGRRCTKDDDCPSGACAPRFNFRTNPSATWYTQNSWTGMDIQDIVPDGSGNIQLTITWVPTSVPSFRFIDPPGGESVGSTYQVRFEATDVFGGTTIGLYYMEDQKFCSTSGMPCTDDADCTTGEFCKYDVTIGSGGASLIGNEWKKTTPGTNDLSRNWNIGAVSNGRYVFFAELIPGTGADGTESPATTPAAGRNNQGTGSLVLTDVNTAGRAARLEAWMAECVDIDGLQWRVNSNLTQPVLNEDHPEDDPYPPAFTGVPYTSDGDAVTFTINQGSVPFALGDTFTFTTTGITAVSRAVTVVNGKVKADPTAVIIAAPLAGNPPLRVTFDGRGSFDPNGEALTYLWNFGYGSATASGARVEYEFKIPGSFTTILRVTNPNNGRFGEAAVDIEVTNNSPRAVVTATPTSGSAPLDVQFSGAQSSDTETPSNLLIYTWDFGDGDTANNALAVGTDFQNITHFYRNRKDGTPCTSVNPCTFVATLTVIDEGGKQDTDTVSIRVGNTDPVPVITHTALQGPDPFEVVFNAKASYDPDGNTLTVEWIWGDGTSNEILPTTGASGATDGSVPHTYVLPSGETSGTFATMAIVRDGQGGEAAWGPVTVTVSEATVGSSDPRAIFTIDPPEPVLGEEFTVDGSLSFDRPLGGPPASYVWEWDDGTATSSGVTATHTYTQAGTYTITLTVADDEDPPNTNSMSQTVIISSGTVGPEPPEEENVPPSAFFTVNPSSGFARTTVFTFNASGSNDPDGDNSKLKYSWSFGDGATGSGAVMTHVYDRPNANGWLVRLRVRDEGNASTDATQVVAVEDAAGNLPPLAFIATGPRSGTAPITLTFDGRNSFDPNGDPLEFRWDFMSGGAAMDILVGPVITKLFSEPGNYTVELEVSDGRGGVNRAGPETILVTARVAPPADGEEPPGQQIPDGDGEIPNSADQRPGMRLCGFGMIGTLFASLLGLTAMRATRRRRAL